MSAIALPAGSKEIPAKEPAGKPAAAARPSIFARRRAKTPTVLQIEAVECGAAALSIVLAHYGKFVPLEILREQCGVSRDGSKAANVLKVGRMHGLVSQGFKKEPEELRALPIPAIVFWNFNHFVVLEGFGRNKAYLNDPATGPRTVSLEEFDQSFTGVVLTFSKSPDFRKGGKHPGVLSMLARRMPGARVGVFQLIAITLLLVIPGLIVPAFSRIFVDNFLVGAMYDWIKPLLVAMGATALLYGAMTALQQRVLQNLQTKLAIGASAKFLWHLLRLPIEFFGQRMSGEIGSRVEANDRIAGLLSGDLATNFVNVILIVFYAAMMFQYDVMMSALSIGLAVTNLAVLRWTARRRADMTRKLLQEQGKLMGTAMAGLQIIETLKSNGSESDFFMRWAGYQARAFNTTQNIGAFSVLVGTVPMLLTALNGVFVICIGGTRVMNGALTLGMLLAFQTLVGAFMSPLTKVMDMAGRLQEAVGDLNRLEDVMHHPESVKEAGVPAPATERLSGHIELRKVTFGYSKLEQPLLKDFSLTIKPGQRVAIVGGSGSGKSTVAKLVSGLFTPWSGDILFDGKPVQEIPRSVFTSSVAMVDQDIFMFEGTIRENLTLWDSTITERAVVTAAQDSCIHDDIASRPSAYDAKVEEGGRNFSGGQRQRMEICRALTANPSILILDEATSALDPRTEKLVDDQLRFRGCTCLIVAHRLSTIRDADEIIVLQYGRVVQRGTHDQLSKVDGAYARLIRTT